MTKYSRANKNWWNGHYKLLKWKKIPWVRKPNIPKNQFDIILSDCEHNFVQQKVFKMAQIGNYIFLNFGEITLFGFGMKILTA